MITTQAVDIERAALKRKVRDVANGTRNLAARLRREMNAMDAAPRASRTQPRALNRRRGRRRMSHGDATDAAPEAKPNGWPRPQCLRPRLPQRARTRTRRRSRISRHRQSPAYAADSPCEWPSRGVSTSRRCPKTASALSGRALVHLPAIPSTASGSVAVVTCPISTAPPSSVASFAP